MSLRFALLRHNVPADYARSSHWDLLFERDTACWTWALESLPAALTGTRSEPVAALRLNDHRKHYLEYEGPVSGERGEVRRVLAGEYELCSQSEGQVVALLQTKTEKVIVTLDRAADDDWSLTASVASRARE